MMAIISLAPCQVYRYIEARVKRPDIDLTKLCQIRRIRTTITDVATSGTFLHRLNDGTEATCFSEAIEFATSITSYRYISYAYLLNVLAEMRLERMTFRV